MSTPADTKQPRILIVDDDPGTIRLLAQILKDVGKVYFTTKAVDAVSLAISIQPDIVLLDVEMPDLNGMEVCEQIISQPLLRDIPILFVTSHNDVDLEARALTVGAIDFIHKPPTPVLVKARVRNYLSLKQQTDRLKMLSMVDGLTGIANRRAFDLSLAEEWRRAIRGRQSLSLIMFDVDHFKRFNDEYGHQSGDDCLRSVATTIEENVKRPGELAARYGGEEFVVLLPTCSLEQAVSLAEIVRKSVELLEIPHSTSSTCSLVSVSCGVANISPLNQLSKEVTKSSPNENTEATGLNAADLVKAADKALYVAKRNGRNRVEVSQMIA